MDIGRIIVTNQKYEVEVFLKSGTSCQLLFKKKVEVDTSDTGTEYKFYSNLPKAQK